MCIILLLKYLYYRMSQVAVVGVVTGAKKNADATIIKIYSCYRGVRLQPVAGAALQV